MRYVRYEKADGKALGWPLLKRMFGLIGNYKKVFYASSFLACFLAFLSPLRPFLIQKGIDDYIFNLDGAGLLMICILIVCLLIIESAGRYGFIYLTNWMGQNIVKDLRVRLFSHVLSLKLRFYDKNPIGALSTRVVNDLEAINNVFSQGIVMIIADVLTILLVLGLMCYYDVKLAIVTLLPIPVMIFCTYVFQKNVRKASEKVRVQVANMNTLLQEYISGMALIKIFSREEKAVQDFDSINQKHRDANIQTVWYYAIFFPVVELLLACSIGAMIWWGGERILSFDLQLGHIVAFILYVHMLYRPIRQLADRFGTLQMGIIAGDRVFKVLDENSFIENKGQLKLSKVRGDICFENVSFAYNEGAEVLKNINFKLDAGKTLAVVGSTGAGKSTLINALCRFYDINSGTISLDGHDVRELELNAYRQQLCLVLQDVFLFSGSIAQNIHLGKDSIDLNRLRQVSKDIGADDFIKALPEGYQFDPKERGISLSMGQRQLISFMRALAYDPKILILDEATSSVDSQSEALIQKAIQKLLKDRTSIIIAHRLSTIKHASQIIVMDDGKIVESGTHKDLLSRKGNYYKLYETQFKLQSLS